MVVLAFTACNRNDEEINGEPVAFDVGYAKTYDDSSIPFNIDYIGEMHTVTEIFLK